MKRVRAFDKLPFIARGLGKKYCIDAPAFFAKSCSGGYARFRLYFICTSDCWRWKNIACRRGSARHKYHRFRRLLAGAQAKRLIERVMCGFNKTITCWPAVTHQADYHLIGGTDEAEPRRYFPSPRPVRFEVINRRRRSRSFLFKQPHSMPMPSIFRLRGLLVNEAGRLP